GATQLRVDDVPDGDEVGTFVGDDVDRRLEDVLRPRVRLGEGEEQVLGGANGLRAQVARRDDPALVVQRTRAGGEHEPVRRRRVLVRHSRIQRHREPSRYSDGQLT